VSYRALKTIRIGTGESEKYDISTAWIILYFRAWIVWAWIDTLPFRELADSGRGQPDNNPDNDCYIIPIIRYAPLPVSNFQVRIIFGGCQRLKHELHKYAEEKRRMLMVAIAAPLAE
jgi:hypothetical protein